MQRRLPAPVLVLCAVLSVQTGATLAKGSFDLVDPIGMAGLRHAVAAAILLLWWRPRPPANRREWLLVLGLGTMIAGMNASFLALGHLAVGIAATLFFLGPFCVALLGARRLLDAGWAVLAAAGVILLTLPGGGRAEPIGLLLGAIAGLCLGGYVLLNKRVGATVADGSLLAWAVTWAACLSLPFSIAAEGTTLFRPAVLLAGLVVGVLSAALPYSLELSALRRLPPRVVGVLQSLEPVAGSLVALLILGELLEPRQWIAVVAVTVASLGAVLTRSKTPFDRAAREPAAVSEPRPARSGSR